MNERIEEQPYDDRHNTPPVQGEHIGDDHQERDVFRTPGIFQDGAGEVREEARTSLFEPVMPRTDMPSRIPGQHMLRDLPAVEPIPTVGLSWRSSDGTMRTNLAAFPWANNRQIGVETSNIELRTIYAHLIEAATLARAEMRERGMQVDL
jgi:hypothetical protein